MRKSLLCVLVIAGLAGMASAQSIVGKKIVVQGGSQAGVFVPVSIDFEGPAPDKGVQVVDAKTKKAYPATARDGKLVFVLDELPANAKMTLTVAASKAAAQQVTVTKKGEAPELDIAIAGEPFTTYHYSNDNRKPFLWPVLAEGKTGITRDWPMTDNSMGKADHVHHKSIWTSYGDLNGTDCWGEDTKAAGFQHSDEVTFGSGDAYGWVHAKNTWQDKEHKPVISEEREYRFYAGPAGSRIFDETITFTANYGEVKFGDTKEGGLVAFRIRPDIAGEKGGMIQNAEGGKGEDACWGKKSPWCDYWGNVPEKGKRGIAVFDTPGNLRYPTNWHVRNYGLNGANCFGLKYFTEKEAKAKGVAPENGDFVLENGKAITFKYRVIIHSGDTDEAKIADRYADYTNPPKAEWAK